MQTRVVRVSKNGGPEVLESASIDLAPPGPGEVRLRQTAIGVNFIDVYQRSGLYAVPLPAVLGNEGAGVVEALGAGVTGLEPGARVAYAGGLGGYAERRNVAADKVLRLPDGVDDRTAAAAMLKGMTARYLLKATRETRPGDVVVVHAAAGGTGQILVQWASAIGARVVAVVGSTAKADVVKRLGAERVVVSAEEDFVAATMDLTNGRGADVVYDSVGKDTFFRSLEAIRVRGLLVSFGQSSGAVPPFSVTDLSKKCAYLTRPTLFHYTATRADLEETANDLFDALASGRVKIAIGRTFPLADAALAHRALEARETTGSTLLLPDGGAA
jgi:NADPH2:quinone reductase